jgi:hypothetical protein
MMSRILGRAFNEEAANGGGPVKAVSPIAGPDHRKVRAAERRVAGFEIYPKQAAAKVKSGSGNGAAPTQG